MKESKNKATSSKIKWNLLILIIFISSLGVLIFTRQENTPFPVELTGRWETDDPRYIDRFFEIDDVSIIFGLGDDKLGIYFIEKIEKEDAGNSILFKFKCTGEENSGEYLFQLQYEHTKRIVNFSNIENVNWLKTNGELSE